MSLTSAASARLRRATVSEMLPNGFHTPSEELPRSTAPKWMTWTWIGSVVLTVVVLGGTLLGPMDEFVLTTGMVRPAEYALVLPQISGQIASVEATPGMRVKAGQVLAHLDTLDLERERATLNADLAQAEADLAIALAQSSAVREAPLPPELLFQARSAQRQQQVVGMRHDLLTRMEGLGQSNNVSLLELTRERMNTLSAELDLERCRQAQTLLNGDYAKAQIAMGEGRDRAASARVAGLRERLTVLDQQLARRIIRAPADGLVISRAVRFPGEKVEQGTALFKLAFGTATQLRLYASEDRVNRIKPGMLVRFRTRSDPDRLHPMSIGRVEEVALDRALTKEDGESIEHRGSYAIDVTTEISANPATNLPLGAAVDAEIVLGERPFWHLLLLRNASTP